MIKSSSPAVKSKSYTAAVKVSTSNIVIQTDLTTVKISIKRFQILKKTPQQQQIVKANKQNSKAAQVSLDSNKRLVLLGSWAPVSLCQEKTPKKQSKDSGSARFKKAEKQLVLTNNLHKTLAGMDDLMDRSRHHQQPKKLPKKKINAHTNSVILWNCQF